MAVTIDGTNGVSGPINVTTDSVKLDGNYPVGTSNVALGDNAMDGVSGSYNTAVGDGALSASGAFNFNTAVGFYALNANTGSSNTAMGRGALQANTSGNYNTGIGHQALNVNLTGERNTALGYGALVANTASNNTAVGQGSLGANTTGDRNTAVGMQAADSVTTAVAGTFVGYQAGQGITTGGSNTFVGADSGELVTTGANNTIIGRYNGNQGGLDIRTLSNRIVLSDGDGNIRASHNAARWRFGTNQTGTAPWDQNTAGQGHYLDIGGTYPIGACSENRIVCILNRYQGSGVVVEIKNGTGVVGTISHNGSTTSYNTSSDYRLKENVVDLTDAIDRVKQLKPSQFNFIADPDTTVDGFLAHEVQSIVPEAITGTKDAVDENGNPEYQGIDQSKLVPLLTAALKEAITEIEALKERVATLESN